MNICRSTDIFRFSVIIICKLISSLGNVYYCISYYIFRNASHHVKRAWNLWCACRTAGPHKAIRMAVLTTLNAFILSVYLTLNV